MERHRDSTAVAVTAVVAKSSTIPLNPKPANFKKHRIAEHVLDSCDSLIQVGRFGYIMNPKPDSQSAGLLFGKLWYYNDMRKPYLRDEEDLVSILIPHPFTKPSYPPYYDEEDDLAAASTQSISQRNLLDVQVKIAQVLLDFDSTDSVS